MRQQFNLRSILLQYLSRNTDEYAEGEQLSLAIHTRQTGGFGYSSSGILPTAGAQRVKRHTYNYARLYGTIEFDGSHEEGARKSNSAEVRPFQFETTNLVKQMRHGLSFDLYGDGSGEVATPATATGARTLTVADTRGLHDGMKVDVLLTADGSTGAGGVSGAEISVNVDTKTVTIDTASDGLADAGVDVNANPTNYRLYRAGSYNDAVNGLAAIVSASNPAPGFLGGIDRTAAGNEFWQANVLSAGGVPREPTLALIDSACTKIETRTEGTPSLILCSYEVYTRLTHELVASKRYSGSATKLNGWASALMFNDVPIVRDKHCPKDKIYVLDMSEFTLYQNNEGNWIDKDGAVLSRISGKHAYEAAWFRFLQPVCHLPAAQAVIEDIDTTVPE